MDDKRKTFWKAVLLIFFGVSLYFIYLNFGIIWNKLGRVASIISPFVTGFIIAFLLNSTVNFFEKHVLKFIDGKKPHPRLKRGISIAITLLIAFAIFVGLMFMIIPQIVDSVSVLLDNFESYMDKARSAATQLLGYINVDAGYIEGIFLNTEQIVDKVLEIVAKSMPAIYGVSTQIATGTINFVIGIIIAVYFMFGKERLFAQLKKTMYAIFKMEHVDKAIEIANLSSRTFTDFIMGKLVDSLIIGILCFIGLTCMRIDYALLLSAIIGVTNIIPCFGPIFGAVPVVFIVLIAQPEKAIWVLIFIIILQQFDGNILGPRILGNSIGLPAIWVMFAIIIGGGLFGVGGMIIGVPVFAVIYILFKTYVENKLGEKGLSSKTSSYYKKDE